MGKRTSPNKRNKERVRWCDLETVIQNRENATRDENILTVPPIDVEWEQEFENLIARIQLDMPLPCHHVARQEGLRVARVSGIANLHGYPFEEAFHAAYNAQQTIFALQPVQQIIQSDPNIRTIVMLFYETPMDVFNHRKLAPWHAVALRIFECHFVAHITASGWRPNS